MAHTEQDVLDLMNYTEDLKHQPWARVRDHFHGKMGKVSRITSDVTGSSWSFASLDEASAQVRFRYQNMKKIRRFWMKLDSYTRLAAVVANPIKHSISPSSTIGPFERQIPMVPNSLGDWSGWFGKTVANIRRYQMFGINLGLCLQGASDSLSGWAWVMRLIDWAVNTVINHNGTLIGYNTDGKDS